MVDTQPSRSPEELRAILDSIEDDDQADLTPAGISANSARSMLDKLRTPYRVLKARFSGDLPAQHEIGVGPVTSVLGEFQNAIAEIGAAVTDTVPKRGPLSAEVLNATELRFSPQVSPGSVIFTLIPVRNDDELWDDEAPKLLDRSLEKLFQVFEDIERPGTAGATPDTVPDLLRTFGPRTARHLFNFADALSGGGLALDFGWLRSGHRDVRARLSSAGARYLGDLAKNATTRSRDVKLFGKVTNLGEDNKHRFKDDEFGFISLTSNDAITDQLITSFKHGRVEMSAIETETVSLVTGLSKRTFEALSVEPLPDTLTDDS